MNGPPSRSWRTQLAGAQSRAPVRQGRRTSGLEDDARPLHAYLGGMRVAAFNASWPLARLKLFPGGIRLQPSAWLFSIIVPVWEARYDELTEVQAVGRIPLITTGIRFRVGAGEDWIIFWSFNRARILRQLTELGVAAGTTPGRFHMFSPGR